jgi:hypothetical protein
MLDSGFKIEDGRRKMEKKKYKILILKENSEKSRISIRIRIFGPVDWEMQRKGRGVWL